MTKEEKLSKALQDFKTKYPNITSADLQTFIIGWNSALSYLNKECDCNSFEHCNGPYRICRKCGKLHDAWSK